MIRTRDSRHDLLELTLLAAVVTVRSSIQAPNSQRMLIVDPVPAIVVTLALDAPTRSLESHRPKLTLLVTGVITALVAPIMVENDVQLLGRCPSTEENGRLHSEVTHSMIKLFPGDRPDAIYFIVGDRTGFTAISSPTCLLPAVTGHDLAAPYDFPEADAPITGRCVLIARPEEPQALRTFETRHSPGEVTKRYNHLGRLLFFVLTTGTRSATALPASSSSS